MQRSTVSKLTDPIVYDGDNYKEQLQQAMDIFFNTFLKKDIKPLYEGKFIFFDMQKKKGNITLPFSERFLHIVSLDDEEKYTMFPCANDVSYELCETECNIEYASPFLRAINRWDCPYRLARIHWIKQVIDLANEGNSNITEWDEYDKDSRGQRTVKRLIRYHCGMDDYVVILLERKNDYYFYTAYPVLTKTKKATYDRKYREHVKEHEK